MSQNPVVQITDLAFGGKGVARHEGMVIFVPFTAPGDTVEVEIIQQKKKYAEGCAVRIITPGPGRVMPQCQYFGECGGCAYQHLRYDAQLAAKCAQVEQALRRVGRLAEVPMQPAIPAPNPWGYRNRIRVHRAHGRTGFFGYQSRELVDIQQCLIAEPAVNQALRRLRNSKAEDGDYSLRAPGGSGPFFEQVNEAVTRALVELLDRTLRSGQQLLVDAYCGGGRFARALAGHAEKVIGIETSAAAVDYARKQAGPKESYVAGDVADQLGEVLAPHDAARTSVIVDPPPEGLGPRVLDLLLAGAPSEIAYVACNPSTLARDLAVLTKSYRLTAVTPLDMFAQTAEIEVCAHLVRS
jgi:23S rRNA (uracil1939-C5)-methyltransferase